MPELGASEAHLEHAAPKRRDLLQIGMGAFAACYAGALGYPVYRYLATPSTRAAAEGEVSSMAIPAKDLPGPGSATMFLFGSQPSMLIHHEDKSWVAFDAVCTHLGCTVGFEPENKRIFCPCHGGTYDMHTGAVVAGPPPKGLTVYKVEANNGNITVSRA